MRKSVRIILLAAVVGGVLSAGPVQASDRRFEISEFTVDERALCELRDAWVDDLLKTHEHGTWAKMDFELTDDQLASVGLPSADVLRAGDYSKPTLVTDDGRYVDVPLDDLEAQVKASALPQAASYGGTGCLGIRPGALLLSVTSESIGWCSLAHVYGSPGGYDISTAGHCGGNGDTATVIAGFGNRADATGVVLLDFGRYAHSVDGGLGNDHALIDVDAAYQGLVTPTMCFWGGPRGRYDTTGEVVGVEFRNNSFFPEVSLTPNPALAQSIVHYGHGTGMGAGGTPRAGEAIAWGSSHFMFSGAIAPGDSGSGANTIAGDAVGDNMEAAGIITHIWVHPLMRDGIGIMGGTRASSVGTPANGQIVPWPAPLPILP